MIANSINSEPTLLHDGHTQVSNECKEDSSQSSKKPSTEPTSEPTTSDLQVELTMMMEQMRKSTYNQFSKMQNEQFDYFTTHLTKVSSHAETNNESLMKIESNLNN
eukprot:1236624-Ditylum_brightwellii.AAC.1